MGAHDPASVPASLQLLRARINAVRPAAQRITSKSWSNLRSNFRAAVLQDQTRRPRQALLEWRQLHAALPDTRMKNGLSRFISYCEANAILPAAVSDAVSTQFLEHLDRHTLVAKPRGLHRNVCRLWNKALDTVPGWPAVRLTVPDYRPPRRTLPLSSFPASVQDEFARYFDHLRGGDLFAEEDAPKRLASSTMAHKGNQIRLAISALAASGEDPGSITSLACVVQPEAFKAILRHYCKDGEPTFFARDLAQTLVTLARHWVRVKPADLAEIRRLQRCLGNTPLELTEKNRTLLRSLDHPAIRARLFALSQRLAKEAERAAPVHGAVRMQIAVAIAILQSAPLRIANLAALRIDRHLVRPGGPRSLLQIDIPPHEVKNGEPLAYELPREVTALIDRYSRRFRPAIAAPANPYLFPVRSGPKSGKLLSHQITQAIADWVGIAMTPHQFRHFAARLMLQHSPGAFGAASQLLGHKHIKTTISFYSGIDTLSAGRQFDAILEAERRKARSLGRNRL
jgi:integrase